MQISKINFWTAEEIEILRAGYSTGHNVTEISSRLPNRSIRAVYGKARNLGLKHLNYNTVEWEGIRPRLSKHGTTDYQRMLVLRLGAICHHCDEDNLNFLTIDHKKDDGNIDRKAFDDNQVMYRHYLRHLSQAYDYLQVLCYNCNTVKKLEMSGLKASPLRLRALEHLAKDYNKDIECFVCRMKDLRAVEIDHIHGKKTNFNSPSSLYYEILRNTPETNKRNYQLLCANHNQTKSSDETWIDIKERLCLTLE